MAICCSGALCDPMDCSMPGFPVLHHLPKLAQTHVHWVDDVIPPSHPLSPPSLALNLSQHQVLFQWVGSSDQVAKVLELQLQHQSFQWIFRVYFFLGLTGLISLHSKGPSRVFYNITFQKRQFFGTQPYLFKFTSLGGLWYYQPLAVEIPFVLRTNIQRYQS